MGMLLLGPHPTEPPLGAGPEASRRRTNLPFVQWLLLTLALLGLGSVIGLGLYFDHRFIDTTERARLATQARVIDDNFGYQLLGINLALESVRNDLSFLQAHQDSKGLVNARLQAMCDATQAVRTMLIFDANGTSIAGNRKELIGQNFGAREYFQIARQGHDASMLYLSQPFTTALGNYSIAASKVMLDEQGRFKGLVVAILDPAYFKVLLDSVRYAPDMWVSLAHADGKLFVMIPARPGVEGVNLDQPGSFRNRHLASGQRATVMTGIVAATGEERMMAQRFIKPVNLPMDKTLAVGVARDLDSIFAVWRRDAYVRGALFAALFMLASLGLYLYQKRQRAYDRLAARREAEREQWQEMLVQSDQRFKLATSTGNVWDWNLLTNEVAFPQEFWRALGYDEQDIGDPASMLKSKLYPQDGARWQQAIRDHISQHLPYDFDYRMRTKSGEYRWFNTKGQASWDENGRATYMAGTTFDITERKRTEEALREKEFLLSESQRLAHIGSWQIELVTGRISWTEEAYRIYGIAAQTFTHNMASFYPLVHADDQAAMKEWGRACRAGERPGELEFRATRPDGSLRFLTGFGDMQYDADQQPLRMIGTVQDITERKQAEQTLRQSEERFRLAAANGDVWSWDIGANTLSFPAEFWLRLGYPEHEIDDQVRMFEAVLHPQDRLGWHQAVRDHITQRLPYALDFRACSKFGEYRWFHTSGQARWDQHGRATYMAGTTFDITERKLTEQALERRSAELTALNALSKQVNASLQLTEVAQAVLAESLRAVAPDLALLFLREGGELRLLASAAQRVGLGHEVTPVHRLGQCMCGLAAAQGRAMYSLDIHADPRCTWNECKQAGVRSFAALPLRSGETVIGVLGLASASARDFASQSTFLETFAEQASAGVQNARMHSQIERHVAELDQRVVERTAQLEAAKERAETADRTKSTFLATMSHELRTPLNSIIGFTGVLLQKLPGPLNAEQEKQLSFVQNAGRHLLALICDVLDISKVEAGELHLAHERFDLHALIERVGAAFALQAERRNVDFILDIERVELVTYGDARRVEQVLNNLLSNALKFTPDGRITLACKRENHAFVVSVADTGVGIRAEDMDKLFRPFGQIETGRSGIREGTGLGLAISKRLVEAMGGEVRASSEWGKGSRFSFTLSAKELG